LQILQNHVDFLQLECSSYTAKLQKAAWFCNICAGSKLLCMELNSA